MSDKYAEQIKREAFNRIKNSDKLFITPTEAGEVLGCEPYSINLQAKQDIGKLGFNACLIGTRVRIPRMAFIAWVEGGNQTWLK